MTQFNDDSGFSLGATSASAFYFADYLTLISDNHEGPGYLNSVYRMLPGTCKLEAESVEVSVLTLAV